MDIIEYGSEFDLGSNHRFMRPSPALPFDDAVYYRSGRDALKSLARIDCMAGGIVLLPALCCESMITPFRLNGCELRFYDYKPDLSADCEDVLSKLCDGAMLIYMSYFGIRPFEDEFLLGLRARFHDLVIVEDRTQDIVVPRAVQGFTPDAVLASLRKWAALPEGGVLQTKLPLPTSRIDSSFGDARKKSMADKSLYLTIGGSGLKQDFMSRFHTAEHLLDEGSAPVEMSAEYLSVLCSIDFSLIYEARLRNIAALRERLAPLAEAGRLRFLTPRPEASTLYFPLLLDERDRIWRRMIDAKIYCAVLWPVPAELEGRFPAVEYNNRHMLGLICDQRYDEKDMDFIADTLIAAL